MLRKILVTSLVAIGAVSCAYNRPVERDNDARVERNDAPAAPRARPMGEGEMETPGVDSAPDPTSPDIPVAPESGSDEPAPGATIPPSGVPSADPSGGASDDDILSPADDTDVMTPGEAPMPPDTIAPSPTDDGSATDDTDSSIDGDTSGTDDASGTDDNEGTTKDGKKKKEPGKGEGEPESDADDDTTNDSEAEAEDEALPGDAEIDG